MTAITKAGAATVDEAVAALRSAMAAVANGDVGPIKALYSHTEDVSSFYGWGGYEVGWDAVAQRWEWAGQQFQHGRVSYLPLTRVVTGDLFYLTDIETFEMTAMAGMTGPAKWSNRVTHIFRRESGCWRLVHRHGNRLEDQFVPASRLGRES